MIYPICEKYIDDRFNSWDEYILEIQIWLKKDWFNRNIFIISYIPKNLDFNWIKQDIEKLKWILENHKKMYIENNIDNILWY